MTDFGSFAKLFDENGYYGLLLNLHLPETRRALETVKEAAGKSPDLKDELSRFFHEPNWRPHLVAATALAFVKPTSAMLAAAWEAFDLGSWVCPQLAAVLSLYDKNYKQQAIKRLIIQCLKTHPLRAVPAVHQTGLPSCPQFIVTLSGSFSEPRANDETTPALMHPLSSKAVSSLAGLLADCSDPEVRVLLHRPETAAVVAADSDHGNQIATEWRATFQRMVKEII